MKRPTSIQYASSKCAEFSTRLPAIDPIGLGLQAPHETIRLWMGCAIFCKYVNHYYNGKRGVPFFSFSDVMEPVPIIHLVLI